MNSRRGPPPGDESRDAERAFSLAYDQHSRAVLNVARAVCGSAWAEDVTHNVFLALWRDPGRFDPRRGSLRTLLLRMARNMAIDMIRSGSARRQREDRIGPSLHPASEDVEARVENDDDAARIRVALDTLPGKEKDAIVTAYYGDCTYRQAAVVLGESEGTIKSRIRAGLRRLPAALEQAGVRTGRSVSPSPRAP